MMGEGRLEYESRSYDLDDIEDVKRLAGLIGVQWAQALAPLAASIPAQNRAALFGMVLAPLFGAMSAAVGLEDAALIAGALVEVARANRKQAAH